MICLQMYFHHRLPLQEWLSVEAKEDQSGPKLWETAVPSYCCSNVLIPFTGDSLVTHAT